jgi:hypothetical protein
MKDLRRRNMSRHANDWVPTAWELQDETVIGDFIKTCKAEEIGKNELGLDWNLSLWFVFV